MLDPVYLLVEEMVSVRVCWWVAEMEYQPVDPLATLVLDVVSVWGVTLKWGTVLDQVTVSE